MSKLLKGAPWLHAMARVFDDAGAPLYLVGGAVRNPLMGLPISDIDVCGPTLVEDVCALCEGTPVRARLRAAAFGTVELYITDENGTEHMAEYTAWREDRYTVGHKPSSVHFTTDISVDASRRDFTVNALYQRVHADGLEDVCDPTGGLEHLKQGLLHTVKPDPDLVLSEDGQRILRAVRFQAELDLTPTPEMLASLRRNAHLLGELSCEMLRDEWEKILMADLRYPELSRRCPATETALCTLVDIGAWDCLFKGVAYDASAAQALNCLQDASLAARLALLLHRADLAAAAQLLKRMRLPSAAAAAVTDCLKAMRTSDLLTLAKLGMEAITRAQAVFAALGDANALQGVLTALEGKPLSLKALAVSGSDLKPLFEQQNRPLREMGSVLEGLWLKVLQGELPNERAALIDAIAK